MKPVCILLTMSVLATSSVAVAEETDGKSLMQQGAELFFKGLTVQVEPALDDLLNLTDELGPEVLDFLAQMGPALEDLFDNVEDWSAYHPPERLPNGDIIIRRKDVMPENQDNDQIEL